MFEEKGKNDYYSMNLKDLNYTIKSVYNNTRFFKIENYQSSKFIVINIQSSKNETITILTSFDVNTFIFPPIQIYSYQLVYLNDNKNFTIYVEQNSTKNFRILINNTFGNGEINFNFNSNSNSSSLNNYNSLISGNRILSLVIQEQMKTINIFNKNYKSSPLLFSIKVVYELKNQILEELYFNNEYKGETKASPIQYFLKEIQYEGADINFYIKNRYLNESDLIIRGYILKYDLMKLIADRTFLQLDFGNEIKGKFDNRTNIGLLSFEIGKDSQQYDCYYLIEIVSANVSLLPQITLDIFATSKNPSQFSMPIKKYISGSFDLTKEKNQKQRYYINDAQNSSSNDFIIELSSNYENIDISFSNDIGRNYNGTFKNGGIRKYLVNINKTNKENNYFDIIVNNTHNNLGNGYCKSANYLIRYYQSNVQIINYTAVLSAEIKKNGHYHTLTIKNGNSGNISGDYYITCIFSIYEKDRILIGESINTTAFIESEKKYLEIRNLTKPFTEVSFNLTDIKDDEEYKGSVFIIFRNISDEGQISYYSFDFNIIDADAKNKDKKWVKLIAVIIGIVFAIIIIIAAIVCIVKYRKMSEKNRTLEQRVNEISFSSDALREEEEEGSRITFV